MLRLLFIPFGMLAERARAICLADLKKTTSSAIARGTARRDCQ